MDYETCYDYRHEMEIINKQLELDEFTAAYIEAALWSTNDESDPSGGDPLDNNYTEEDIDLDSRWQMIQDCRKFQAENAADIATWESPENASCTTTPNEQAGHDFWLTRNGHGVGFWESEWGEPGQRLDKACEKFGECNLYVGDDGLIYI